MTGKGTMSRRWKNALFLALFPTAAWSVLLFALFFFAGFRFDDQDLLHQGLVVLAAAAAVIYGITASYAFVWVLVNLRGGQRVRWIFGFVLGGSIAALVWWWTLIRPLPEPDHTGTGGAMEASRAT
jgi:predicted neutral ceramidase superfamily lipid hydrolase